MKGLSFYFLICPIFSSCQFHNDSVHSDSIEKAAENILSEISDISLPAGYRRITYPSSSFATYLRSIALKKENIVHLYNGQVKRNQKANYVVLDIPVGNKDLQQCADAVMRIRAEYLLSTNQDNKIIFYDNNHTWYKWDSARYTSFDSYLEKVFSMCGTLSLQKQLKPVIEFKQIQPGDVLIKGGTPGHAVLVMDLAVNDKGEKIYLLAQSYMPAQEIHVLVNPFDKNLSPWYAADENNTILTPEWIFYQNQLMKW